VTWLRFALLDVVMEKTRDQTGFTCWKGLGGREEETVMGRKTLWIIGVAAAAMAIGGATAAAAIGGPTAAAAIGRATAAVAASTPGDDQPLTGTTLQQASDAAIAHTGQGTVISAETDDDADTSYEVNVQLDNGSRVEVELNSSFQVVATENADQDDD
jgi:uncharacterized membrane protein YkoI